MIPGYLANMSKQTDHTVALITYRYYDVLDSSFAATLWVKIT